MDSKLSILMIAAETHPFAKVGGLADVMGALPRALEKRGHEVRIALPFYGSIKKKGWRTKKIKGLDNVDVVVGDESFEASAFSTSLPDSKVEVILIQNERFFNREGIYSDPETGKPYDDNAERFIFFSRASLAIARRAGWKTDIIHCHDHQTGFVPAWLRHASRQIEFPESTRVIFTIHNLAYQGSYPKEIGYKAGFGEDVLKPMGALEFHGNVNMMKAGIVFADMITTVSPTYATEIQTPEFGYGLEGVLKARCDDLVGILNGADYTVWDPQRDKFIAQRYSLKNLDGKRVCRKDLLKKLNLEIPDTTPLIGMVSRLVAQKGLDIFMDAFESIVDLDYAIVILGLGEPTYHEMLKSKQAAHPERISLNLAFDEALAHQIEAGCDMFLMPSRYEPCGLNQMYSMKYGTIPVVRKTGGLADTVIDFDASQDSTGFVFEDYSPEALLEALRRARRVFDDKAAWLSLVKRAMARDFSWDRSAGEYERVYLESLKRKVVTRR